MCNFPDTPQTLLHDLFLLFFYGGESACVLSQCYILHFHGFSPVWILSCEKATNIIIKEIVTPKAIVGLRISAVSQEPSLFTCLINVITPEWIHISVFTYEGESSDVSFLSVTFPAHFYISMVSLQYEFSHVKWALII